MPRGRARSEVCRECGQPRSPKAKAMPLCEEHRRAYNREQTRLAKERKKLEHIASVLGSVPARPRPRLSRAVARTKPKIRVVGDRVTMSAELFQQLTERAPSSTRLAVVSHDMDHILFFEARPAERHTLPTTDARYTRQIDALREAGFIICFEE